MAHVNSSHCSSLLQDSPQPFTTPKPPRRSQLLAVIAGSGCNIHIDIYKRRSTCLCTSIHTHIIHIYICMYIHIYIYIYVCSVCACIYIYTCMDV